ncbi:MAG: hypothetical protein Q7K55_05500, partial [Candidatus Levybacteria bacterium]|nr:hypothetical protein [Candidatus Levybacteria bacterium]
MYKKLTSVMLLCFLLNIVNHGSPVIGILNSLFLGLLLFFYQSISGKKLALLDPIYFLLLGVIPIFTHKYEDIKVIFFAMGLVVLMILYLKTKINPLIYIIFLYIFITVLFVGQIINPPFLFQGNHLILSDNWTNTAIRRTQDEALYMPYTFRLMIFNGSVYLYIILSKVAELFMIGNLATVLLIANIYPLVKGLVSELKSFDRMKFSMLLGMLLISLTIVLGRSVDIFNAFYLMSPFLIY